MQYPARLSSVYICTDISVLIEISTRCLQVNRTRQASFTFRGGKIRGPQEGRVSDNTNYQHINPPGPGTYEAPTYNGPGSGAAEYSFGETVALGLLPVLVLPLPLPLVPLPLVPLPLLCSRRAAA